MNRKLKIFGLAALVMALVAGAAWALVGRTLSGTNTSDFELDKLGTDVANEFNFINGNGTQSGSVILDSGAVPMVGFNAVLDLHAAAGNTVTVAPGNTERLAHIDSTLPAPSYLKPAVSAHPATAPNRRLQLIVNGARDLADNSTNTNNGTVFIKGSNNEIKLNTVYTNYWGGTFVYGGALQVSNNASLGQGWIALMGRSSLSGRPGAKFQLQGTTKVQIGIEDATGQATGQPLYLVADVTEPNTPAGRRIQSAVIDVDTVGDKVQELWLNHGVGEAWQYGAATNVGTVVTDTLLTFDPAGAADGTGTIVQPRRRYAAALAVNPAATFAPAPPNAAVTAPAGHYMQLVKTGKGLLYIGSDGTGLIGAAPDLHYVAIDGARHEGGTVISGGTLKIDGKNAVTWQDRYTGYLGNIWLPAGPGGRVQTNTYLQNSAFNSDPVTPFTAGPETEGSGAIHNPLTMLNDAKLIVDRTQIFSYFNGTKDTVFRANEFSLAGVNESPWLFVTLNRANSTFDGKMEGKFNLVLDSKGSTLGALTFGLGRADAQATLKIGNPENDITGFTRIRNGVLEVTGANSIASKGTGNLTVGIRPTLFGAPPAVIGGSKAVFLYTGEKDAVFANKTFVNGTSVSKLDANARILDVVNDGALAAATGKTISFKDVTISRAMEINPQAVLESITAPGGTGEIVWTNTNLYPTWGGTVQFGMSSDDVYNVGGSASAPTQIFVSRGTFHLGSMPADINLNCFANVMVREAATLSLGKDVNDFSNTFDLQVDDDARIRLVVREGDLAKTREEAMQKPAIFNVRTIDTTWLGAGPENKDRRLAIQMDVSGLATQSLKKGAWIKVIEAKDAIKWNNLHYLRDNSDTIYEDYAKVRPGFYNNTADLTNKVVAHMDENAYAIYLEVLEDVSPQPEPPAPVVESLSATLASSATDVAPGTEVTFTLGDIKKADGTVVPVADVDFGTAEFTNCTEKTAFAGGVVVVTAGDTAGAMTVKIPVSLKADATVKGFATGTATVAGAPAPTPTGGGSSGGCDAGFAGLALLLAVPMFFRKKD